MAKHRGQPAAKTLLTREQWNAMSAEQMLRAATPLVLPRQVLVRYACLCARAALASVSVGDRGSRVAIETAEAWTRGEATVEQVRTAAIISAVVGDSGTPLPSYGRTKQASPCKPSPTSFARCGTT